MATMMARYASQIKLIKGVPDFNRQRALKRFILLMDFKDNFFPQQQPCMSRTKALCAYAKLRNTTYRSLLRWSTAYKKFGIKGLVPKFGTRISNASYEEPSKCKKAKLLAAITIDAMNPLKCLVTLRKIIERYRMIPPDVRSGALSNFERFFHAVPYEHQLSLRTPLSDEEIKLLNRYKLGIHKKYSKKATAILMASEGRTLVETMNTTHAAKGTIYRWLRNFRKDRMESIEVHVHAPAKEREKAERQKRVIDIVHTMPSLYGINRTTWTYGSIAEAYQKEYGAPISVGKIQGVIHDTNYTWRRARNVLTSPDPDYKAKVEKLLDTLQGLKEGERFFFIDEVGPYRVKKYGGRVLMPKGQTPEVPENQKSRGKIQFVAALEAVTNQLTWLFTPDKSAVSMVRLFEKIVQDYADCPAAFFTWDAISVHSSKVIMEWISAHNKAGKGPHIEVVPLPSKSQFLNVIEAVFGGMKRAVICNSDYATPHDMQEAIARHFEERNQFFRENPKRAGNKIWDKQKFDFDRLAGGLFKKM
ncbi:MAG: IS630 family transposase [Deltaproteobacteria bacterium]|nr:IS630 family transposase [Deltaproteobacteria bacterium]